MILPHSLALRGRDWTGEHGCYVLRSPPVGEGAAAAASVGGIPPAVPVSPPVAAAAAPAAPRVGGVPGGVPPVQLVAASGVDPLEVGAATTAPAAVAAGVVAGATDVVVRIFCRKGRGGIS